MRLPSGLRAVLACVALAISSVAHAQDRKACDLFTRAEVESVLGVALEEPMSQAGGASCHFTNFAQNKPRPPQRVDVSVNVQYAAAPNRAAVEQYLKFIDEKTYDNPAEVSGLGDAAVSHGGPNAPTLAVFRGGTMVLTINGTATLEQLKALALKALGEPGTTGFAYGTPRAPLPRPALSSAAAKPGSVEQLKRELTAKADAGSVRAQMALAKLYEFGSVGADGNVKPDYVGAAYWYQQASDGGDYEATYSLAVLYRDGSGVAASPATALELLRKAALAGYVPAMVPLSYAYAATRTGVSDTRARYWAQEAARRDDPAGWALVGYLYNKGYLGGSRPYWYKMAMDAYLKGAEGGDCVAMMNIGGLYFNGDGAPQDRAQAEKWFAKSEACKGKDLDWLREKAAKYRQKAATGHLPKVQDPDQPSKSAGPKVAADGQKVFGALMAMIVLAAALDVAQGSTDSSAIGSGGTAGPGSPGLGGSRGSSPAPVRHCRQVSVGSFSTAHGRNAISPSGATTTVCD